MVAIGLGAAELDRAEERLGSLEGIAELHEMVWGGDCRVHYMPPHAALASPGRGLSINLRARQLDDVRPLFRFGADEYPEVLRRDDFRLRI